MNYKVENGTLTVLLSGRVDSANTEEQENALNAIIAGNSFENLVLDMENLEYISSAGLRMVLRARKAQPSLKIINTSPEVYEIFDITGFTEMMPVEKAYRRLSVDGCEVIGKGAKGTVYRYDAETVVKVYKDADSLPAIKKERELARKAFVLGVPTAIPYDVVRVGDSYGSVFELLNAESYSLLIAKNPERIDSYAETFSSLLKKMHSTQIKKGELRDMKPFVLSWAETAEPYLKKETGEKLKALINAVPDRTNLLHCDYHTNNIMLQSGETLLIDMDTVSSGHPIFELANIYITYIGFGEKDPAVVESFIGLPYDTAVLFWKKFLPLYLETRDEKKIKETENKAALLSYTRLMRHIIRRGGAEKEKETVDFCSENIEKMLSEIDTLDF